MVDRGAGVSGTSDHELRGAAAAGKGAGAEAGDAESGATGSQGPGEYSFA